MGSDSKRIGSFKEFLRDQRMKKINEEKINIECDFWDECIVEVMQDLKDECNGFLDYDTLLKFVKDKFSILGRPDGYDEEILLQHIKDLIYQHHWNSWFSDGKCNYGDKSEVQAKGLVVGELAKVILDKVLDTIPNPDDPIPGVSSVSLTDQQPKVFIPVQPAPIICDDECEDDYDDLPFECKQVMGFGQYSKLLQESTEQYQLANKDKVIKDTLKRLEQEAGSLDIDRVTEMILDKNSGKITPDTVKLYIKNIILDLIKREGDVVASLQKAEDTYVSKSVVQGLIEFMATLTVEDVLKELAQKHQGLEVEGNEETE